MQVGVKCIRGEVSHQDCRACAINPLHPCDYPIDVLELMRADYLDDDAEPGVQSLTPTRLLGCDRQAVLLGRHDYYLDVDNAWFPVRGNMVHALMQRAAYPGALRVIREVRFKTELDGVAFTGKPDLVVVQRFEHLLSVHGDAGMVDGKLVEGPYTIKVPHDAVHVKIVDYKSTNLIGHDLVEAKREHELQVNMYAWLVSQNPCGYNEQGEYLGTFCEIAGFDNGAAIVVDEIEIVYADMKKCRRLTSAGWLKTRGKMTSRSPRQYASLDLAPLTLYSMPQIERFVQRRIAARQAAGDTLPPVLDGDAAWKCDYCPVREACFALARGE